MWAYMNRRLIRLIKRYGDQIHHGTFLNCYNGTVRDIADTLLVGVSFRNLHFVAVGDEMELKKELCNKLIEDNLVEEGDIIVHSYANSRLSGERPINVTQNKDRDVGATITTRADCLGVVVKNEVERIGGLFDTEGQKHQAGSIYNTEGLAPNIDTMQGGYRQPLVQLVGGVGEMNSNGGTQYYQQDRVYDSNGVALCQSANESFNPWYTDPQSCLIQPMDRDYQAKGEKREIHIETKNDGVSHNLLTHGETMVNNGLRIRKLTPKECWRLMYWDDESFEKAEKVNSNAQLYRQAGNGICVNVMSAIFKEML